MKENVSSSIRGCILALPRASRTALLFHPWYADPSFPHVPFFFSSRHSSAALRPRRTAALLGRCPCDNVPHCAGRAGHQPGLAGEPLEYHRAQGDSVGVFLAPADFSIERRYWRLMGSSTATPFFFAAATFFRRRTWTSRHPRAALTSRSMRMASGPLQCSARSPSSSTTVSTLSTTSDSPSATWCSRARGSTATPQRARHMLRASRRASSSLPRARLRFPASQSATWKSPSFPQASQLATPWTVPRCSATFPSLQRQFATALRSVSTSTGRRRRAWTPPSWTSSSTSPSIRLRFTTLPVAPHRLLRTKLRAQDWLWNAPRASRSCAP